jgi:hypothetical protein
METHTIEVLINALLGPGGALVVAVGGLYAVWKLITAHLMPLAIRFIDMQQGRWEQIIEEHRMDRVMFRDALDGMVDRMSDVETEITDLKVLVKEIVK